MTEAGTHSYVLLGASDGSFHEDIDARPENGGLSSLRCFAFIIELRRRFPLHIFASYSFNYDDNMMFKDMKQTQINALCEGRWASYRTFRIRWVKGKWLELKHEDTYVKVYDLFSFFGCKFEKAVKQYLDVGEDFLRVEKGKAKRSTFRYDELESIIRPYMHIELEYGVKLCTKLRDYLTELGVFPRDWHGPGAVANYVLSKQKIMNYRPEKDVPFIRAAAAHAYQAGHFEQYKTGLYEDKVYQFDLNSAYPWAATLCPELTTDYEIQYGGIPDDFSLCEVFYFNPEIPRTGMNPFPMRNKNNCILYPNCVQSWVWGIEYKAAIRSGFKGIELVRWIKFDDNGVRPFDFVHDIYERRLQWKREHNPVEHAAKLIMNSIYGKLAQRAGWERTGTAPHWHQLRWAGFITAACRARMLEAMAQKPESIIAIETDGVFTTEPLNLELGKNLGQFDGKEYDGIIFIQSGVYFAREGNEWTAETTEGKKTRTRGFSPNEENIHLALSSVDSLVKLRTIQNRFHGLPSAKDSSEWRQWLDNDHDIVWGGGGKRFHSPTHCTGCTDGENWHETIYALSENPKSYPHDLPWEMEKIAS